MYLPLINVFDPPYEIWNSRETSLEERLAYVRNKQPVQFFILEEHIKTIQTHFDAAVHILNSRIDVGFERYIDDYLEASEACKVWKKYIPRKTSKALLDYKTKYPKYDKNEVDKAIKSLGLYVSEGQIFFHGGIFDDTEEYITERPLSVSFCPQVALRNAEWFGKAYDRNRIDLVVLKAVSPSTNAYFYRLDKEHGNEKEVLFASGVKLRFIQRTKILDRYHVCKAKNLEEFEKYVPVYVVEAEFS